MAKFVEIHEKKKKGKSTDIPPLIRSDWANIWERKNKLTIKSKIILLPILILHLETNAKKRIRTRKHSTGNKTLDQLQRGYQVIKNAVRSNNELMQKVNVHL